MSTILIVDDDPQLRQSFERILADEGHHVQTAPSAEAGLELARSRCPDLVVMDFRLPGMNGLQGFKEFKKIAPKVPVIIMTAFGSMDTAIEATKLGAFDYVIKPFDIPEMLELIEKGLAAGRFMRSKVTMNGDGQEEASDPIVGRSRVMQEVYKSIGRVASTEATVLIRGESGTGKELVARAVYQHSDRAEKPFLVINCVAIPETLLESELFGYEKGAFTGAHARRVGKIEQANGGTVFLDEIGDMPLTIQAKILRLLQERSIERLGGRHPIPVDVRVIAATNRDLETALGKGDFREDLYYRLKVVTLHLPPLRERGADIERLAEHFVAGPTAEMSLPNPGMTREAKEELIRYSWPGNVRELGNTIQKALIFSRGCPLTGEEIRKALTTEEHASENMSNSQSPALHEWIQSRLHEPDRENRFTELMDEFAAAVIGEALTQCNGNRSKTAKFLGISRPTLLARIEKLGIRMETRIEGG